ncbi:MAG: type VI secretion system baseplate subunit TssK [Kiritimatiellae bacterium]|nr:type VI secretion system baseplate subunit TssK [Kiritimatiellia bacterium]
MAVTGEVHWHEGLFLQPHHLQAMQRHLQERLRAERRLAWSYPYGVVDMQLSPDALENMLIQFDRLHVVMASGVEVRVPEACELPALDIKEPFESGRGSFTVYLGVPLWYGERGNVVDGGEHEDWRVKRIYRVAEVERPDENTGENPQAMRLRLVNARLLLEDDDPSDLELLPLMKIAHAAGEDVGLPRRDAAFIPPCLTIHGSPILRDLLRDLANQVAASRKELVLQISRGGFSIENMRGVQFEQMLRLGTLNRFSARLPAMVLAPATTPFEMYLELRELLGELSALYPDRDQFEAAAYDHDSPALAFQELSSKIRSMLRGAVAPSFMQIPFEPEGEALLAALNEEHLTLPNEYFLGIRTREDPRGMATVVEDQDKFKVMAKSLASRAIWGIKLALERMPPLELPSEAGLTYFRLLRGESTRMWDRIAEEKAIAIRWPGMESSDFKITLYMTVPSDAGNRKK